MHTPRALTTPAVAVLVLCGAIPLAALVLSAFLPGTGPAGGPDAVRFAEILPLLGSSLLLASGAATAATALAVLPGLALGRSDLPHRAIWGIALALPAVLPPVLVTAGWRPWTEAWLSLAGGGAPARLAGACVVLALLTYPIPLFLTALAVRRSDRTLEDLARLCGGRGREVRSLVGRLARPGVTLGWLLVFLLALSESAAARLLDVPTYATRLEELTRGASAPSAGAAALPLLVLAVAVAAAEARLFGERGVAFLGRALDLQPSPLPLGRRRRMVLGFLACLFVVGVLGPLAGWTVEALGDGAGGRLTWVWSAGVPAFARSLVLSLAAGSFAVAVGLPLAYASERRRFAGRRWIDLLLVVLFATPGAVLALGLLRALPVDAFLASGLALVVGQAVHLAVVPYRMERVGLRQLGRSAEEAGSLAGAAWRERLRDLVIPLNAEVLAATWAAAVVLAFRDGSLAAALSPRLPVLPALGAEAAARGDGTAGALGLVAAAAAASTLALAGWLARQVERASARPARRSGMAVAESHP